MKFFLGKTRLGIYIYGTNEVLSGVFDDDFGLSDSESSDEEGENVYTYSGKRNLARGEVVALSKAVSSEP